jgi:hypothetical protein
MKRQELKFDQLKKELEKLKITGCILTIKKSVLKAT